MKEAAVCKEGDVRVPPSALEGTSPCAHQGQGPSSYASGLLCEAGAGSGPGSPGKSKVWRGRCTGGELEGTPKLARECAAPCSLLGGET